MSEQELAECLVALGCPAEKSLAMARQLDRKAQMDAERKAISYDLALKNLIGLMAQGWAAKK